MKLNPLQKGLNLAIFIILLISLGWFGMGDDYANPANPLNTTNPKGVKVAGSAKSQFIHYILQRSEISNRQILKDRARLLSLYHDYKNDDRINLNNRHWLVQLSNRYDIDIAKVKTAQDWEAALKRVDIIPNSLVIAQAINESAWGRSRFAIQGNNYFGLWCYREGCGIVPERRPPGAIYEVAKFPNAQTSVNVYMHNLNTHSTYKHLRAIRYWLREQNKPVTGLALAPALVYYSTRREAYVKSITTIIQHYNLSQYDK
tara:strand:+ start:23565 stop:24341 length:777 start_codon:yes stop_codon:yes gene_type:complete